VSHHALQKALVIALHDDAFVAAMHADPEGTLSPLELDARERAQLLAVDRRAFRTDPLRRRRLLRVLAEELPVSSALALRETRRAASLEAFFSSTFFRRAVIERLPLAPAFGDFIGGLGLATPQLPDVVRLETTTARCRRDRRSAPRPGVALAPGVAVGSFDAGVLETLNRVERWLFELKLVPQLAICADGPELPELPAPGGGTLLLLFTPSQTGIQLTPIDEDLYRALLDPPRVPRAAISALVADGIMSATPTA
jgi:hypothetical protein